jgi:hypothetical protein
VATVLLEQALRDRRLGFLASILGGILDAVWAIATFFVVPVLMVEGVGPIEAIKRSSRPRADLRSASRCRRRRSPCAPPALCRAGATC